MKFRVLYFAFLFALGAILLQSNSKGRASDKGEGNTGAPGDSTKVCQSCHNSNSIQMTQALTLQDTFGATVTQYAPGQVYIITVINTTTKGSPVAWGFQCVTLKDNGNLPYNAFSDAAPNVKFKSLNNGRQYAEHNNPSSTNTFTMRWTAPPVGTGSISFYAAGNAVNLNEDDSGDGASKTKLTITEGAPLANKEIANAQKFVLSPNPVVSTVKVTFPEATKFDGKWRVLGMNGQTISNIGAETQKGTKEIIIDMSQLDAGLYLLNYQDESGYYTRKIVRL